MAPRDDHSRWEELAVGHALSALEPADEAAFAEHLRTCAECPRIVADTREVMGALAETTEPAEPPESLRDAILTHAVVERDQGRSEGGVDSPAHEHADELAQRRRGDRSRRGKHDTRERGVRMPWYTAAAAVVVVLALAAANIFQLAQAQAQRDELARARQQAQQARKVAGCVERKTCSALPLRSQGNQSVPIVALVQDRQVRLVVDGLQTNAADSTTYVLWQKTQGKLHPLSAFDVTKSETITIDAGNLRAPLKHSAFLAVSHKKGNTMPRQPHNVLAVGAVSQ